jgi:hypothetical protein
MSDTEENKPRASARRLAAEFVLIVTSVLVALALEGLRQDRADQRLVDSYVASLRGELAYDTTLNRIYTNLSGQRSRSVQLLLEDLDGLRPPLSPRDELLALHWAYVDDKPLYVTSVLEELLATGNARLLSDSLRAALQSVAHRYSISSDVISGLSFPLEYEVPGLVPGHVRRGVRESIRADDNWIMDRTNLERAADSLLTISSPQGLASIRSWRSVPDVRRLLEQVAYSSEAYTEELAADLRALLRALDLVEYGR